MPMTRILLVDDEQDLVWAMQHSLDDEGYEILTAYDGVEALAVARRHRPDLIILDIGLHPKGIAPLAKVEIVSTFEPLENDWP